MEFSTEQLKPLARQLAQMVVQELEGSERSCAVNELEIALRRNLQKIGQQAMGMVLTQAEEVPKKSKPCECGGRLYYQRRRAAKVLSVFGWVEYKRNYYSGCRCKQGQAPLDKRFGLEPGQVTSGLAALLGMAGVELAYEHSSRWLEAFLLFQVSENTIRKETQGFGELQAEREALWIAQSQDEAWLQERLRCPEPVPKRLYGSLDGAHVRIEKRNREEGEEKVNEWREMKVGCWYTVEPVPVNQQRQRHRRKEEIGQQALRARNKRYFCEIAEASQFEHLFWATGCQAGAELAQEQVFVCDGAPWIWNMIDYHYPQAVQIVDWFHAEERLEKVALEALSGQQAQAWLDAQRTDLWFGNVERVIHACQCLAAQSEQAALAMTYFQNNAHRMRYDEFREQGYMIGSGTVESECKQIVTLRLKLPGAQWQVQGAVTTAKARAAWLCHDWLPLCSRRAQLPLAA